MRAINKVTLQGQLGKDPLWGTMHGGALAVRLVVATIMVDEAAPSDRQARRTEWHRVILEGRIAERVRNGIAKGDEVYVEGSLRSRRWTGSDGTVRYGTEIIADAVQVLRKVRSRDARIKDEELTDWVSAYDKVVAQESAAEAGRVAVLLRRRAVEVRSARHGDRR